MLLLEFLDEKGVFVLQQVQVSISLSVSFLLQKFCYSCVAPYFSYLHERSDNILKGKKELWAQSAIAVC